MKDTRHLELRHQTWYARVTIPNSVRPAFGGKQKFLRSLETHSLSEAQDRRHAVVAEFKKSIRAKRLRGSSTTQTFGSEIIAEAVKFGKQMEQARSAGEVEKIAALDHKLMERVTDVQENSGLWAGMAFLEFSEGLPPIASKLDAWLAESTFTDRTKADHRTAINRITTWMIANKISPSYDLVSNERASLFIEDGLVAQNVHPKTANKLLSGLRTYWKWLKRRGYVEFNPWEGKSLPKQRVPRSEQERPFTDDEIVRLFAGNPPKLTHDLMAIAALSGMRLEEIFQLTVADCADGLFNVRRSKTEAGERKVPIHENLTGIVGRRCAGKMPRDFLIHEALAASRGGTRSMAFSKRFMTFRKRSKVDAAVAGKRRSRVNFHSFRRWFITKADQAGHRSEDIARVVGHKVQGMSLGLYSGGVTVQQLVGVVASVKMPLGVDLDAKGDHEKQQLRRRKVTNKRA